MSSLLKSALIFALILIGIMAFSAGAVCPFDVCAQAFFGVAHDLRPLGRLASGLMATFLPVAMMIWLFATASLRFDLAVSDFVRVPVLLKASALRI